MFIADCVYYKTEKNVRVSKLISLVKPGPANRTVPMIRLEGMRNDSKFNGSVHPQLMKM